MTDLFPAREFDNWAETYDDSVAIDQFPFYGYASVLDETVALADAHPGMRVLDLGTGTGNLAVRLAALGCELWCTDFSSAMLEKARVKLPGAHFLLHDLRGNWPVDLPGRFDRIVSAYVFHHFEFEEKVQLVQSLVGERLVPGGKLVIADIAFPDASARDALRKNLGDQWEQEYYWIADESLPAFRQVGINAGYRQISSYAGIFTFQA